VTATRERSKNSEVSFTGNILHKYNEENLYFYLANQKHHYMRRILLLLSLLFCAATLSARETVDGYYLTLKNDTVRCKIEPKELDIFDKVTAKNVISAESGILTAYGRLTPLLDPDELFVGCETQNGCS